MAPAQQSRNNPATPNTEALATYAVGDTVEVQSRTWPGINKPGGAGRVVTVNADVTTSSSMFFVVVCKY